MASVDFNVKTFFKFSIFRLIKKHQERFIRREITELYYSHPISNCVDNCGPHASQISLFLLNFHTAMTQIRDTLTLESVNVLGFRCNILPSDYHYEYIVLLGEFHPKKRHPGGFLDLDDRKRKKRLFVEGVLVI